VVTTTPLARLRRHVPLLVGLAVLTALAAAFLLAPDHMLRSVRALETNTLGFERALWGYTWWAILVLTLAVVALPGLPVGRGLFLGVPVSVALVLLLAYSRVPYRIGMGDSANRMLVHFAPLALLFIVLKVAPHLPSSSAAGPPRR
jgi:hypothetical protein